MRERVKNVQKRNGSVVAFDLDRISNAVYKTMLASEEGEKKDADFIARKVSSELNRVAKLVKNYVPTVENIGDVVERELITEGFAKAAKNYILYREERARRRKAEGEVPEHVRALVAESKQYFPNSLSEFVYYRSYSKWIPEEGRRETWIETVNRYVSFMKERLGVTLSENEYNEVRQAILKMEVMPSMRLMWSSGKAASTSNVAAYNCSYIAPASFQDFGEIVSILMCGTGVGYSVEAQNIQQLPLVKRQLGRQPTEYKIEDSKEGWADAVVHGMKTWYAGHDVKFDLSGIRQMGARLETMGGRASGPEPLQSALNFIRDTILRRQGRRITCLDAHDIICKLGEMVVAGGVRRSALISLSDLDDYEIRRAKEGHFYISHAERSMANNSAVYVDKPTSEEFLDEWLSLVKSRSGERGIFNRGGLVHQVPKRRLAVWEEHGHLVNGRVIAQVGCNPCGEINLLSKQFCNLTEVVCRSGDDVESLKRKIRIATLIGTYQSMLTEFKYLSKEWKENCERERLLGVSLTGQWDCPIVRDEKVLNQLRAESIVQNEVYASRFGINPSTAITCIKPSGTVSQLVDASSGMHPRHSPYYIRRIRISSSDPLFQMLRDQGLPFFPEVGQTYDSANTFVFEFPVKSPEGSTYKMDLSAKEQLDHWKVVKQNYTEHNPSVTVSVGDDEWITTLNWLWKNWNLIGGLSFLPKDDHVYQLAPYEEITEKRYLNMTERFKFIDYSKIITYEREDATQGSKELACVSGVCEI